jgi:hypothetical protein
MSTDADDLDLAPACPGISLSEATARTSASDGADGGGTAEAVPPQPIRLTLHDGITGIVLAFELKRTLRR